MLLSTSALNLNIRPLVAHNLKLAVRGANALHQGTAVLHQHLSRSNLAKHLRAAERDPATTTAHRMGLQTMLAVRNVGTVVTVPLDFAFGTGRWEDAGRPGEQPLDFVKESLAHPCSLGIAGAAIAITVGLWAVIAAFGTALAAASYAGVEVLTQGRTKHLVARYDALQRTILRTSPCLYAASVATSAGIVGSRTLGELPLIGFCFRTPLVKRLPFVAPLTLLGPSRALAQGRITTALVKAALTGAGYGAGYLAGLVVDNYAKSQT